MALAQIIAKPTCAALVNNEDLTSMAFEVIINLQRVTHGQSEWGKALSAILQCSLDPLANHLKREALSHPAARH